MILKKRSKKMVRRSCIILLLFLPLTSFAQLLKADEVEYKWHTLYTMSMQYNRESKFNAAESSLLKGVDLLKQNDATNSPSYLLCLTQLGIIYKKTDNEKKYNDIVKEIDLIKGGLRPGSKRELNYYYQLGVFYSEVGQLQKSIEYLSKALESEAINNSQEIEAKCCHRQALAFYCLGDVSKAINLQEKAVLKDKNRTPSFHKALVHYLFIQKEWSKLDQEISFCFDNCREPILRQFTRSKAKARTAYWNIEGVFFTKSIPYYASVNQSDQMVGYAYNSALFSKGILLTATTKSAALIIDSNNPEMVKTYNHYLSLKGNKQRTLEQDFELQALEDVIVRYQKVHKDEYRKDFRIGWKDVKDKLKQNDVAIEFVTYPDDNGIENYAALVLKNDYNAPKFVHLSSLKQISEVPANDIYTTSTLYDCIWGPLESELEGAENIYFSPTGVLYKIGIEYLPDMSGLNLSMNHKVYRLSSTKELVLSRKKDIKKGVLLGGIDYNTSIAELVKQSPKYEHDVQEGRAVPIDSLDLRGTSDANGFAYLEGTMEEVDEISTELLGSEVDAEIFIGKNGSETNIKNLTNSEVNLLHVATHGFYYSSKISVKSPSVDKLFKDMSLHEVSEDIELIDEDKMMTRSGLILAGANNVVRKVKIPNGVEDGILYADEISSLNLSSVNILILSACQSGLGDIASSEGVFGLQRGFKLSGVGSIIMSLWKVNDVATKFLMTEMYRNLLKGQEKRDAFINAQMALRTHENGMFDKPEFWAAFILLDGIN